MFTAEGLLKAHAWTHDCLDRLFGHCATLNEEELHRELEGFGFPTVFRQLRHIVATEHYWIFRLQNPNAPDSAWEEWAPDRFKSLADIEAQRVITRQQTVDFIGSRSSAELGQEFTMTWPDQGFEELTCQAFVLHHALSHAFHHKGQAVAMTRLLGHPAPDTDMLYR